MADTQENLHFANLEPPSSDKDRNLDQSHAKVASAFAKLPKPTIQDVDNKAVFKGIQLFHQQFNRTS